MKFKISNNYFVMFILFLFILVTYGNIFGNEFLWDDEAFIIDNPDIKDFSNIPKFFVYPGYGILYRPLKSALITVTYKIWNLNKFGYHLNGFLLHFFSTVLIFYISLILFKKKGPAFLTSIIFAIHPIHTERVTGVTGSFDLLGIVFYLLSFFLYLKFRELNNKKLFYFSLFTFILALLSSEEAISLPIVIVLYEVVFNYNRIKDVFTKSSVQYLAKKSGIYFLILIFYLIVRSLVLEHVARRSIYIAGTFYSTMLTMARVIFKYIRLLIFPVYLSLNDTMPFSTSIFDFRVILSLMIIFLVLFYAFRQLSKTTKSSSHGWFLSKGFRLSSRLAFGNLSRLVLPPVKDWRNDNLSKDKLVSFAVFWFFITLMPFYNIIPITSLYAERYLYLPSFSICILFSIFYFKIKNIVNRNKALKVVLIIILIFIISALSIITIKRNNDWQNAGRLWKKTIETSPDSALGYNNLGMVYLGQGKNKEALKLFMRTIELEPDYAHPYNNLGIIYKKRGNYTLAIKYYKKAISLKSDYYEAYYNLGTLYNELGEYDGAIAEFIKAIRIRPTYAKAHNNLGISLMNIGEIGEAIVEFEKALNINPAYKEAQNNLEFAYKIKKDLKGDK